jgi:hypothetical protein
MNETSRRTWPIVLVCVPALLYVWVGFAAHGWDRVWGLAGGLLILTAVGVARSSVPIAITLLVIGALPLAVATWWSIATPVLGILALVLGWLAINTVSRHQPVATH